MASLIPARMEPVTGPGVWYGSEMSLTKTWEYPLTESQIAELEDAMRAAKKSGLPLEEITKAEFPLSDFAEELKEVAAELEEGRGFALIRGLPVDKYTEEESTLIYWGLSQYLGTPVPQNGGGSLLVHVRDERLQIKGQGYAHYSNEAQSYHTDSSDVVGLLCLKESKEGGLSTIASSMAIYNELLATRPDLVEPLFQPFAHDNRNEGDETTPPFHYSTIASDYANKLSIRLGKTHVIDAHAKYPELGPIDPRVLEAWDIMEELAQKYQLDMDFQRGDIQFLNNYTVVHARTAYQDFEDPAERRHLLRLWLTLHNGRPLASNFGRNAGVVDEYGGRGGIKVRRRPT